MLADILYKFKDKMVLRMSHLNLHEKSLVLVIFAFCLIKPSCAQDSVLSRSFGKVMLYHPKSTPTNLVLFVSGDGGWQYGVVNMAKFLANQGALVAGIDAKYYRNSLAKLASKCLYPAADFEQLSMQLQRKFNFENYTKPILAGYSYGATFIYGLLAQAPTGTFRGGIALGFCPDIELPKPLCEGSGLSSHRLKPNKSYYLDAAKHLSAPFIVLNGVKDQTCNYAIIAPYLKNVGNAELVTLDKVGHGFSIADNWLPQFKMAYEKFDQKRVEQVRVKDINSSLPIFQTHPQEGNNRRHLLFIISGDGGWTSFDQGIANAAAKQGMTVIGLDAQKYFWQKRTVEQAASAIQEVLTNFLTKNPNYQISLMGYSFGAGVLPFVADNLLAKKRVALKQLLLLSPDVRADFEIHIADMLSFGSKKQPYDVVDQLKKLKDIHRICVFGSKEDKSTIRAFRQTSAQIAILDGGHHYNNNYEGIINTLIIQK